MRGRRNRRRGGQALLLTLLCLALAVLLLMRVLGAREDAVLPAAPTNAPSLPPAETAALTQAPASPEPAAIQTPEAVSTPGFLIPRGYTEESYRLVNDLVCAYAYDGDRGADTVRKDLEDLKALDPALGAFWEKLMACWKGVNTDLQVSPGVLPDGLPQDDSLCIAVLGFQLHPDGSMSQELIDRCEVALASAEKYPNAFLAVTGGGTAWQNSAATEAGVMARWLIDHGVGEDRILIEDRSLTTADNAVFTEALLRERCPQVREIAVVSSDYHVPLGVLLFEEAALLREYETGTLPYRVTANAACDTQGRVNPDSPPMQKSYVWSIADPHY